MIPFSVIINASHSQQEYCLHSARRVAPLSPMRSEMSIEALNKLIRSNGGGAEVFTGFVLPKFDFSYEKISRIMNLMTVSKLDCVSIENSI